MSQQPLNLRRSLQPLRRHRTLVVAMAAIALVIAVAYSVLNPPEFRSQALVVVPQDAPNIATEVVIVSSEPVLAGALPDIHPATLLQTLQKQVQVKSLTSGVISINAQGSSAAQAKSAANAVASSFINYVGAAHSPVGHISAHMLAKASATTRSGALGQDVIDGLTGALAGLIVGIILALVISRRDRRLRELAEIANSIGVPVLAAIKVAHPAAAAGWRKLLDEHDPGAVEAWRLRQALRHFGVDTPTAARGGGLSLTVLSLSSDPRALALGPQLAAFGAAAGLPTALVLGPQQDTDVTAALRAACAGAATSPSHSPCLQTIAADRAHAAVPPDAQLVVVMLVVDPREPQIPGTIPTDAALLGVSAGGATADQIARVATAAAGAGRDVVGFLVADPEPSDQTSGRIPGLDQPVWRPPANGAGSRVPTGNQTVAEKG
jgi:capsular polysaccharide biosynthesis protein